MTSDTLFTDDVELRAKIMFWARENNIPFALRDTVQLFLLQRIAIALERIADTVPQ